MKSRFCKKTATGTALWLKTSQRTVPVAEKKPENRPRGGSGEADVEISVGKFSTGDLHFRKIFR